MPFGRLPVLTFPLLLSCRAVNRIFQIFSRISRRQGQPSRKPRCPTVSKIGEVRKEGISGKVL